MLPCDVRWGVFRQTQTIPRNSMQCFCQQDASFSVRVIQTAIKKTALGLGSGRCCDANYKVRLCKLSHRASTNSNWRGVLLACKKDPLPYSKSQTPSSSWRIKLNPMQIRENTLRFRSRNLKRNRHLVCRRYQEHFGNTGFRNSVISSWWLRWKDGWDWIK